VTKSIAFGILIIGDWLCLPNLMVVRVLEGDGAGSSGHKKQERDHLMQDVSTGVNRTPLRHPQIHSRRPISGEIWLHLPALLGA
jgi:hypothetical protein